MEKEAMFLKNELYYEVWHSQRTGKEDKTFYADYYISKDGLIERHNKYYGNVTEALAEQEINKYAIEQNYMPKKISTEDLLKIQKRLEEQEKNVRINEDKKAIKTPLKMDESDIYDRRQEIEMDYAYGAISKEDYERKILLLRNEVNEMTKRNDVDNKETLYVQLFAGPGAGKTTCAMEICCELKKHNINAEYVSELEDGKELETYSQRRAKELFGNVPERRERSLNCNDFEKEK